MRWHTILGGALTTTGLLAGASHAADIIRLGGTTTAATVQRLDTNVQATTDQTAYRGGYRGGYSGGGYRGGYYGGGYRGGYYGGYRGGYYGGGYRGYYGGYRGGYYGGYRPYYYGGYRPYYYGGYYPSSYYGSSYYYPSYYSNYYAPYGGISVNTPNFGFSFGISNTPATFSPASRLGGTTSSATPFNDVLPPATPMPPVPAGTFDYNGGPVNPVPLPGQITPAIPAPADVPQQPATSVPTLPSNRVSYPAYVPAAKPVVNKNRV